MIRRIFTVLLIVAAANLLVFAVEALVYTPLKVPTNSMWPSLQKHDRIGVNHRVKASDLERGDLIVFAVEDKTSKPVRPADGREQHLVIKRIVGMPGEEIEAKRGVIAIGETKRLPEPYLLGRRGETEFPFTRVVKNEFWVLGDNRDASKDSRSFGGVPREAIVGRVDFRYWPLNRWHTY